jgi:hypothetical protein
MKARMSRPAMAGMQQHILNELSMWEFLEL